MMTDKSKLTAYGFDYQIVADVMKRHMPHILEDIAQSANELIYRSGGKWIEAPAKFEGKWIDREQEYAAYMEVTRQIIGLLWQCIPPYPDENEPPLLEPDSYTQTAIDDWFDTVAKENDDYRWKLALDRMNDIIAEMKAD